MNVTIFSMSPTRHICYLREYAEVQRVIVDSQCENHGMDEQLIPEGHRQTTTQFHDKSLEQEGGYSENEEYELSAYYDHVEERNWG